MKFSVAVIYQFCMEIVTVGLRNFVSIKLLRFHRELYLDALTRAVNDLMALVKQLRDDIAHQRNEINHLRRLIENCAGCKESPQPVRENCQNANPCFQGVQCYETSSGMRCGRCPAGNYDP